MKKVTAAYVRVSTRQQDGKVQEAAILTWAKAHGVRPVFYRDKFSGKTMDRPGWRKLYQGILAGKVGTLVCWRLDRLGRTVSGLARLFDDLRDRGVTLISLTEGLDLSKPTGRLLANVLASISEFEGELRGERISAGQALARATGKRWGGSVKGWTKLTADQVKAIRKLHADGTSKRAIAAMMNLSWPTVSTVVEARR